MELPSFHLQFHRQFDVFCFPCHLTLCTDIAMYLPRYVPVIPLTKEETFLRNGKFLIL